MVGKSTYQDMCEIVGPKPFFATSSYAAVCEYPMEDGGCIRVKFVLGDRSANDLSSNLIVAVVEADPIGSEFETNSSLS